MTELYPYAPIQFTEQTLNITMRYLNQWGHKGYGDRGPGYTHYLFAHASAARNELNMESTPGGSIPITIPYGMKIQTVTLDGYFPYTFPDEFFDVMMDNLRPFRLPGYNTVKNIFLVGSILTVAFNGNNVVFSELPLLSKWYVKKYTWKRSTRAPDRGGFNLVLWRWYKDD